MAKEHKIVNYINYYLLASMTDIRFTGKKAFGITELYDKEKEARLPAELRNGELCYVGIDTTYPVIIYHRSNGTNTVIDKKNSFGALNDNMIETSNMSLFVYAQNAKIKMSASEFKDFLSNAFPDHIDKVSSTNIGIRSGFIKTLSTNFNSGEIYKKEYPKTKRVLDPTFFLMEIKYSLEIRFKKGCVKTSHCVATPLEEYLLTEAGENLQTEIGENILLG